MRGERAQSSLSQRSGISGPSQTLRYICPNSESIFWLTSFFLSLNRLLARHPTSIFFFALDFFFFEILCTRKCKNYTKSDMICVNNEEKTEKEGPMYKFLVCAYKFTNTKILHKVRKILRSRMTVRP